MLLTTTLAPRRALEFFLNGRTYLNPLVLRVQIKIKIGQFNFEVNFEWFNFQRKWSILMLTIVSFGD